MASFIEFACRCGKTVRATPEQAGSSVRCWSCGSDVLVPWPKTGSRLAGSFGSAIPDLFLPQALAPVVAGALLTTVLLAIPRFGPTLALVLLTVGARLYQELIRSTAPPARAREGVEEVEEGLSELAEWVLAAFAAAGLVAPFLIRNSANGLPMHLRWGLILLAIVFGWFVMPIVLYALNARDRIGTVPPVQALKTLFRQPLALAATLLIFPVGLAVVEFATFVIVTTEEELVLMIEVFYPPPSLYFVDGSPVFVFTFDDVVTRIPMDHLSMRAPMLYRNGLRRGFTLSGVIPTYLSSSLVTPPEVPVIPPVDIGFLALRVAVSILILGCIGLVLSLQARWFGLIALISTSRIGNFLLPDLHPQTLIIPHSEPHPAPAPLPAQALAANLVPYPVDPGGQPLLAQTHAYAPPPAPAPALAPAPLPPAPVPGLAPVGHPGLGHHSHPPGPAQAALVNRSNGSRMPVVLIVDGDRGFAVGLGRILSGRGFAVILAENAREALALVRGARPDLIVLDTVLPDRSGIELCREVREMNPGPDRPILVATTNNATSAEVSAMAATADDYLIKPYVIEALIGRLNLHIQNLKPCP